MGRDFQNIDLEQMNISDLSLDSSNFHRNSLQTVELRRFELLTSSM